VVNLNPMVLEERARTPLKLHFSIHCADITLTSLEVKSSFLYFNIIAFIKTCSVFIRLIMNGKTQRLMMVVYKRSVAPLCSNLKLKSVFDHVEQLN